MTSETIVHWWDGMSRNRIVDELLAWLDPELSLSDEKYENFMGTLNALRSPSPDPATGLMPCGCGGKAVVIHEPGSWGYCPEKWHIRCSDDRWRPNKCGMRTASVDTEGEARRIWNRAMGYYD